MLKTLLFLSGLLCLSVSSFATDVYGIINTNTTWTKANSPYVIKGDLILDSNVTLTIEPGAEVRVKPDYLFYIYGKIVARGTATDTIKFTRELTTSTLPAWKGLSLLNPHMADTFVFEYCRFECADRAIFAQNHIRITNCLFKQNGQSLRSLTNNVYISDCFFFDNVYGTFSDGGGHVLIQNCGFVNTTNAAYGGHLNFNNNVVYNSTNAINGGVDTVTNNLFVKISNIAILGSFSYLAYNKIWQSKTGIVYDNGSGIVEHNTLKHCGYAISLKSPVIGNAIRNNCITKSVYYNAVNVNADNSDLSNNYWGETDSTKIAAKIFDYYDTLVFTRGVIDFIPALQNPDASCVDTFTYPSYIPTGIKDVKTRMGITVYPNPSRQTVTITAFANAIINELAVYSITGERVIYTNPKLNSTNVDISALPSGYYLYRATLHNGETITGKLQKE